MTRNAEMQFAESQNVQYIFSTKLYFATRTNIIQSTVVITVVTPTRNSRTILPFLSCYGCLLSLSKIVELLIRRLTDP